MRGIRQGPEQELVFLWSWGAPPPPYIYPNMDKMLTHLEVLQIPIVQRSLWRVHYTGMTNY